jgi:hypothetical protein
LPTAICGIKIIKEVSMKVELGKYHHVCEICGKSFLDGSGLGGHMSKHHPIYLSTIPDKKQEEKNNG